MYAIKPDGSTYVVQILLAIAAKAEHKSYDLCPNAVHSLLHIIAVTPEGPAEPVVSSADFRMASGVILSKTMGWKLSPGVSLTIASAFTGSGWDACLQEHL